MIHLEGSLLGRCALTACPFWVKCAAFLLCLQLLFVRFLQFPMDFWTPSNPQAYFGPRFLVAQRLWGLSYIMSSYNTGQLIRAQMLPGTPFFSRRFLHNSQQKHPAPNRHPLTRCAPLEPSIVSTIIQLPTAVLLVIKQLVKAYGRDMYHIDKATQLSDPAFFWYTEIRESGLALMRKLDGLGSWNKLSDRNSIFAMWG
ncbi:hypothetical protein EV421DRAFT_1734588 [Armillaria borealis]|uniref:Uncharacterized protein n=1 Tax=Armillaria borealis TaxID=47425 RepID=A0AA39MSD7_9AGAR|nr:hypothetical protein EV421DRAFT_1734588 [Armillaria borealis]